MQSAQHGPSIAHTAYRRKRSTLFAVANDSMRQARRRAALESLIAEAGGVTALARLSGTPKSHFSAITAGRRGVGDALAAKLERVMDRAPGWMDRDDRPQELTLTPKAARIASLWDAMPEGELKERAYATAIMLMSGDRPDELDEREPQSLPTLALPRSQ